MDVNICSLSGDMIATFKLSPSETVADLKEKLDNNNASTSVYDLELLLDGARLEDNSRFGDLQLEAVVHLSLIRRSKCAREILFSSPEAAFELAKKYDALQDQCAEMIATLFLDEQGKPRSRRETMEVCIALWQKLSQPNHNSASTLPYFKDAITGIAVEALKDEPERDVPEIAPSSRHSSTLVRCFPWLGVTAVQALLQCHRELPGLSCRELVRQEFSKLPLSRLSELLDQLPRSPACKSSAMRRQFTKVDPWSEVRSILKEAKEARKAEEAKKKNVPKHSRKVFNTPGLQSDPQKGPPPILDCGKEVLSAMRRSSYKMHKVGGNDVELRGPDGFVQKAGQTCVLAAIAQEPDAIMPHVDRPMALAVVQEQAGTYVYLPESLKMDSDILFAALERDPALRAQFLCTAGKSEISQWKWHLAEAKVKQRRKTRC